VPPPQTTADFYQQLQQYQLMLLSAGRRLWRGMRPDAFDASWSQIAPRMVAFTAGAQLAAAQAAVTYVPAVLEETDQPDEPLASVRPQAFSGVASDGRSLEGLLEGSVVAAKRAVERGMEPAQALSGGQRWLEQALQSAVADAARDATTAGIAVREHMGWVRMVNPPCCSRCAVLAGRWYRWNDGFLRHPGCDCVHIPAQENVAGDFVTDPGELVRRGLITDLSGPQKQRLDDGADLAKVLNESRDRWRARLAADRRREKRARESWGRSGEQPPPGSTIHDLLARATSQVQAARMARAAGIAD
jgi:hypothetical protein